MHNYHENIEHGGHKQLTNVERILDLSVNVNPKGPAKTILKAIQNADWQSYPDPKYRELKKLIATKYNCSLENIHLGNGAADIFQRIPLLFNQQSSARYLILTPCFSEYASAWQGKGIQQELSASFEHGFVRPIKEIADHLKKNTQDICYLCTPASPTGVSYDLNEVKELALRFSETLFVLDLAFIDYSQKCLQQYLVLPKNILKVFSLTKVHGIAGLRIGFCIGNAKLISALEKTQCRWAINAGAEAAAKQCLQLTKLTKNHVLQVLDVRKYLVDKLNMNPDITFHYADAPYVLIAIKNKGSLHFTRWLLRKARIFVRPCDSFGLAGWIRVFPHSHSAIDRFMFYLERYFNYEH